MSEILISGATHSFGGSITMPNGARDQRSFPTLPPTGPGTNCTTEILIIADSCEVYFRSFGPESTGGVFDPDCVEVRVNAGVFPHYVQDAVSYSDDTGYPGFGFPGRGKFGDTIDGTFTFSVLADLVLDTYGEDPIDVPDDAYPSYGGVKIVGEFPSNYGIMRWVPHVGSEVSVSATFGSKSVSVSLDSAYATFSDSLDVSISLKNSPVGPGVSGTSTASVNVAGYPVGTSGVPTVTFTEGGVTCMGATAGPGFATAFNVVEVGSVPSGGIGGLAVTSSVSPSRKATIQLDAYAMDQPHPYSCEWKIVEKYLGYIAPTGGAEYGAIVYPPTPIWTTRYGQSVSADIKQDRAGISVVADGKSYDTKTRSGSCQPAEGYVGGVFVQLDHWEYQIGRVMAYSVPPPGEDADDWRVPLRGRAFPALTVGHDDIYTVPMPTFSVLDPDTKTGHFSSVEVWEGWPKLKVTGDADYIVINGKRWNLTGSPQTVRLTNADNDVASIDRTNTRWPLDSSRRSTIETQNWGVTTVGDMTVGGGEVTALQLIFDGPAKIHPLAPFRNWEKEVPDDHLTTGDGDEYTVEHFCIRVIIGDVEGRQGMEAPHVRRTDNYAPGRLYLSDYAHLSVSTLADLIAEIPGWTATADEDGGGQYAWYIGQGFINSGGLWSQSWDVGLGAIKGQPLYDSVEWPGDVESDVFDVGDGSKIFLVGRKVFRGAAYGPTTADTTVHYSTLAGAEEATQATVGKRYGLVGPTLADPNDWGKAWVSTAHVATFGGVARLIEWGAFAAARGASVLSLDVHASGKHGRIVADADEALYGTTIARPFDWDEHTGALPPDWASVSWRGVEKGSPLYTFYGDNDGTSATLAKTKTSGASFTTVATITGAVRGAVHCGEDGRTWLAWVDTGGAIQFRRYDADMTTYEDYAAGIFAAGDRVLALREFRGDRNTSGLAVLYVTSGNDLKLSKGDSAGKIFAAPVAVATNVASADFDPTPDRKIFTYWIEDGGSTIRAKVYDASASDAFDTNITDADGAALAVRRSTGAKGEARISLLYTKPEPTFRVSDYQGKTFGT